MAKCFLYANCNHKDCDKICNRKLKLSYLFAESELPESKWTPIKLYVDGDNTDFEAFNHLAEIRNNIVRFVKAGANLYLHSSNSGNGKTSWAINLAQIYVDRTWKSQDFSSCAILFVSVPAFLEALKRNMNTRDAYAERLLTKIPKADLVIWDDIAAKSGSEYEINKLLSLIEGRITKNKSNIYTSNLNSTEIYNALGSRLASRVCNLSTDIELFGADKRFLGIQKF